MSFSLKEANKTIEFCPETLPTLVDFCVQWNCPHLTLGVQMISVGAGRRRADGDEGDEVDLQGT